MLDERMCALFHTNGFEIFSQDVAAGSKGFMWTVAVLMWVVAFLMWEVVSVMWAVAVPMWTVIDAWAPKGAFSPAFGKTLKAASFRSALVQCFAPLGKIAKD